MYVHIAHADGPSGACVTNNLVRRTMIESNMKASINYTWLVKPLHNVLSSFAISLVLFCPLGFCFFCTLTLLLSLSPCRQPSDAFSTRLHKTRTLRRTSRAVPPHPPLSRSAILPCPLVSILCPACSPPSSVHVMHEFLACECK